MFDLNHVLSTVRSASFNEEVAQELLLELVRKSEDSKQAFRVLDVVDNMVRDSRALENLYQALSKGEILLVPNGLMKTGCT
ncbi:hypothetical protein FA158_19440 [Pseudomonas aeruginosa]|uniref:hypothetical protein n=1 Tax=Pseudomonas aeruginosa TaxID=287 RepID=UPI0009BAA09B|nr:hypothetical protein [Pseudomonas aeruginosa]ARC79453.1 hypothetical protein AXW93_11560 [Pseudomonas aeruginosa]MCO3584026.1 hypothetical protein [Pseudomonas aeruginosa]MCO3724046.1 hypothetical protein [Pseudomonas aeruginosa]RUH99456.1 hypothetical protein IPC451_06820 [Pseudomonas aeruginosa]HBO5033486.1 hypothetical protein [Pseudomonas aeruginosa]